MDAHVIPPETRAPAAPSPRATRPRGGAERRLSLTADADRARRTAECTRVLLTGATREAAFACELAVAEACANVVEHAYGGVRAGVLDVVLRHRPGWFSAAPCDEGARLHRAPRAALPEAWDECGRGLPLMAACMDRMTGRRVDGENRLLMVRRLDGAAAAAEEAER